MNSEAQLLADQLLDALSRRRFLGALGRGLAATALAGPALAGSATAKSGETPSGYHQCLDCGKPATRGDFFSPYCERCFAKITAAWQAEREKDEKELALKNADSNSRFDYAGGSEDVGYSNYAEGLALVRLLLKEAEDKDAWIGVDLDGTLARYTKWKGSTHIGSPIPRMVRRVRRWVSHGKKVKIFTARADDEKSVNAIKKWLKDNDLPDLEITNLKDQHMTEIWDDRAVSVQKNTGKVKEAQDIEQQLIRAAKPIKHCGDYGTLYYNADKQEAHWTAADSDGPDNGYTDTQDIVKMLKLPGIKHVEVGDEWSPDEEDGWKRLI